LGLSSACAKTTAVDTTTTTTAPQMNFDLVVTEIAFVELLLKTPKSNIAKDGFP